jgi:hypothetical protein
VATVPTPELHRKAEAAVRVLRGGRRDRVARDVGLASTVVTRAADDLITPGDLQPLLQGMAADFGLVGRTEFPFLLDVGAQ